MKDYRPTLVKLNCEGCEHYILEQLSQLPQLGVEKIAIQFHEIGMYKLNEELDFLKSRLRGDFKIWKTKKGVYMTYVTVNT